MKKVYIYPQTETLVTELDELMKVSNTSETVSIQPQPKLAIMPGEAPRIPDPAPAGI